MLCDTLASKLMKAGNTLAATLCYICAGNIDKTVEIWSRSLSIQSETKSYVDLLQVSMELPNFSHSLPFVLKLTFLTCIIYLVRT